MASLKFLFAFVVLIRLLLNLYDIFSFSEFIIINVIYQIDHNLFIQTLHERTTANEVGT